MIEEDTDIRIFLFGQLCDIAGSDSLRLKDVKDTDELQAKLIRLYPRLASSKYIIAVDKKMIRGNTPIRENNDIALLPPFSGG